MTDKIAPEHALDLVELSHDELDKINNPPPAITDFDRVVESAMSRRGFLGGTIAFGAAAFVMGTGAFAPNSARAASRLDFGNVAANSNDTITLPSGYSWQVVARWGDPLWSKGVAFDGKTKGTAADQALAFGDNTDGMEFFSDGKVNLLAVNNEYTTLKVSFAERESTKPESEDDVRKVMAWHGVSIFEVAKNVT
ncbi:MAG: hypothetical protein RLZ98_3765, partial [Pseudomonadota bacterium]